MSSISKNVLNGSIKARLIIFIGIFVNLVCNSLQASQVIESSSNQSKVFISNKTECPWLVREEACVFQKERKVACGRVSQVNENGALLDLDFKTESIEKGHTVKPEKRLLDIRLIDPPLKDRMISGALAFGTNYYFPFLSLELHLIRQYSIGLTPLFLNFSSSGIQLKAYGTYLTFNYSREPPMRNLWVRGGVGFYLIKPVSGTTAESYSSLATLLTVGWRERWGKMFDVGASVGVQYVLNKAKSLSLEYYGLLPIVTFDIGYRF